MAYFTYKCPSCGQYKDDTFNDYFGNIFEKPGIYKCPVCGAVMDTADFEGYDDIK